MPSEELQKYIDLGLAAINGAGGVNCRRCVESFVDEAGYLGHFFGVADDPRKLLCLDHRHLKAAGYTIPGTMWHSPPTSFLVADWGDARQAIVDALKGRDDFSDQLVAQALAATMEHAAFLFNDGADWLQEGPGDAPLMVFKVPARNAEALGRRLTVAMVTAGEVIIREAGIKGQVRIEASRVTALAA